MTGSGVNLKMNMERGSIRYPRRRILRWLLRAALFPVFAVLTELRVYGRDKLPEGGPLLVAVNHFSFIDPAVIVRVVPWPLEVLGATNPPHAPVWGKWLLELWGNLSVQRGTAARAALREGISVLSQGGVVGIAPEGMAGAEMLRPARPGAAYLAVKSSARVLPIGIDGASEVIPSLRRGRRPRLTVRIGEPIGPFQVSGKGRILREQLDEIGHEMMRKIAALLPPERRGYYSDDPKIRAMALGAIDYIWDTTPEG